MLVATLPGRFPPPSWKVSDFAPKRDTERFANPRDPVLFSPKPRIRSEEEYRKITRLPSAVRRRYATANSIRGRVRKPNEFCLALGLTVNCFYCDKIKLSDPGYVDAPAVYDLGSAAPRCARRWWYKCGICGTPSHFMAVSFCPEAEEFFCSDCASARSEMDRSQKWVSFPTPTSTKP